MAQRVNKFGQLGEKRLKYGNVFTVVDGIKFRSKRESVYYQDYKLLERAGKIKDLELQPRYKIVINGEKICTVVLDFQFREVETNRLRVVDVKGMDDKYSQLKRKLVQAVYPHVQVEVVR